MNKKSLIKTLIITGANGIIGSVVCEKALENGFRVAAFDLQTDELEKIKKKYPEELLIHACDIRVKHEIELGLSKVLDKWHSIDGLFNNAAWKGSNSQDFFKPFEDWSLESWRDILSVNLDAVMLIDQIIGSYMANVQGFGSIVHTASIYGVVAPDQRIYEGSDYLGGSINTPAVYSVSKGAVIALMKHLAAYWGHKGVRVNAVSPGGVESGQNTVFKEKYSARVPLARMAKAEEIAEGVLFLLSDQSCYITGHNLVIDGGLTVW
ncbi:MAG: SDR family oxidoreductase [Candidatus Pacebacteria bacterium]|nr:SDR family oxidoreductase [Candidatus Paceibacterota bacterium]